MRNCLTAALCLFAMGLAGCPEDDNLPPDFVGMEPEVQAQAGETVSIIVSAQDPEGKAVTLTMEQAPPAATFVVSGFGRFVWEPSANDASAEGTPHNVVFKAVDADGVEATFRVVIVVTASEGETRFITTNSRVLVLERDDRLEANVSVQADTKEEVTLELTDSPSGMSLNQDSAKSAEISWKPTDEQIAKKLIWSATITADPGSSSEASQTITITLVPKPCADDAITVAHTPLGEQRGSGDYNVDVQLGNLGGAAAADIDATLFWRAGGDPDDSGGFEGVAMANVSGESWRGTIPNPSPPEGEPVDVYYFVVAAPKGSESQPVGCLSRSPDVGLHNFPAFADGDNSCRVDKFEPNDDIAGASVLTETAEGVSAVGGSDHWELYGLQICGSEVDLFAVDLEAGKGVAVLNIFDYEAGDLTMRGLAPDGTTVIIESSSFLVGETAFTLPAAETGTYYIEVSGAEAGYQLYMDFKDNVDPTCIDTTLEPNETAELAIVLPPNTYDDLRICPDDKDYFAVNVPVGFTVTVDITFAHSDGDLDLKITDGGSQVAGSFSETDNESTSYTNSAGGDRNFGIQVQDVTPGGGSNVPYSMVITLEEGQTVNCDPDFFEANDTFETAFPADAHDYTSTIMCADDDFFAITGGTVGQKVVASVSADDGTDLDLDLEILDPSGSVVASSSDAGASEQLEWSIATDGNYVVRVFRSAGSVSAGAVGGYALSVTLEQDQQPCEVDANEENGAAAFAWMVADAPQKEDIGICPSDVDFFAIQMQAGEFLLFDVIPKVITDGDPYVDVSFQLLDDGQNLIKASVVESQYITTDYEASGSETLFIRVENAGTVGYLYDIDWVIF